MDMTSIKTMLLPEARRAAKQAYCPYSKFHVGAAMVAFYLGDKVEAVGTERQVLQHGCNVENTSYGLTICSYGLTICAERNAVFGMVAAIGADAMRQSELYLAVSCPDGDPGHLPESCMPCGACRQVIREFDVTAVFVDGVGDFTIEALLPKAFIL